MSVLLLFNPKSGRGTGQRVAGELERTLVEHGIEVTAVPIREAWQPLVPRAGAIIAAGGDGTVHAAAGVACGTGVPIHQCPLGTENLFAREFDMTRDSERIAKAILARRTRTVDAGVCNGRVFVIVCSVGCDANVIHRLDRRRKGAIRHASYARPILREWCRPAVPTLRIRVDDEWIVEGAPGLLMIANSRQYASRVDPAPMARMDDGLLDIVFFPHRTSMGAFRHIARARMRRPDGRGVVRATGTRVRVESIGGDAVYQLDGEASGRPAATGARLIDGLQSLERTPMDIELRPRALTILLPAR